MYRVYHKAVCTNCGHVARQLENREFLDPFFLPDHCEGCGEYRSSARWPYPNKDWRIETVKLRRVKQPFHPLKPSTWFSSWEPVADQSN